MQNIFNSIDKVNQQYLYNHKSQSCHYTWDTTTTFPRGEKTGQTPLYIGCSASEVNKLKLFFIFSVRLVLTTDNEGRFFITEIFKAGDSSFHDSFLEMLSWTMVTLNFCFLTQTNYHPLDCIFGQWSVWLIRGASSEESESESKYLVKAVPPRPLCVLSPVHCWCPQDQLPVLQTLVTTGGRLWLQAR